MSETSQMRCFQVHPADNVATALDDLAPGEVALLGAAAGTGNNFHAEGAQEEREGRRGGAVVVAVEEIKLGHKIALGPIGEGEAIVKFGVPIGMATTAIAPGAWVHLHNCRSQVDERSSHLDVTTGAALDTAYA
jgi:hypothetical protein